jgi:NADH-quinone oxidoreductase subunit K
MRNLINILSNITLYESLCVVLFFISLYGIVYSRKNLIINLIFIELGFLSINLLLIINSWYYNEIKSQIIIIYILSLTAIETAVGLALFILYYKMFKNIEVEDFYKRKF